MSGFWNVFAVILACFVFGAYLVVLFAVFADLFRNHSESGLSKALWVVFLIILPVGSTLIYVIIHGDGMAQRAQADARYVAHEEHVLVDRIEHGSPAHRIKKAKELLDSGVITEDEFQARKQRALSLE